MLFCKMVKKNFAAKDVFRLPVILEIWDILLTWWKAAFLRKAYKPEKARAHILLYDSAFCVIVLYVILLLLLFCSRKAPPPRTAVPNAEREEGLSGEIPGKFWHQPTTQQVWVLAQFYSVDSTIKELCLKSVFLQTHNQGLCQLFLTVSWDLRA